MSRNAVTAIIVVALLGAVGLTAGYFFQQDETFGVVFKDAKQLEPGANVYLSGVDIGDVKAVNLDNGKVKVLIKLDNKFRNKIPKNASFFIIPGHKEQRNKSVLVQISEPPTNDYIKAGDIVEGIDSEYKLRRLELSEAINEIINSESVKELAQNINRFAKDFKNALDQVDWNELEEEIQEEARSLSDDIDKALQSEEIKTAFEQIEKKINKVQNVLQGVAESEEAKQLQKALENFYQKLDKELTRPD
jgi:paraquat-inducible protein B